MKDKIVGVVAEFNPFHNGHKYQIDEITKNEPKIKIAVISGNFVQRGEVSVLNKFEKAKIAIKEGYDIVVELPVYYSIQNADVFCEYSVKILNEMGCEIQVFGIEEENLESIYEIIKIQKDEIYQEKIRAYIKQGHSYIKAHELTLKEYGYEDVYKSNNILAMSYIKSIEKNSFNILAHGIKRIGSGYNEEESVDGIASATMLRKNINGNISSFVPLSCSEILEKKENINPEDKIYDMFRLIFNVKTKDELIKVYDFNDSMYNRVEKCIQSTSNMQDFLKAFVSRNFTLNRIKRVMLNTLLNITDDDVNLESDIDYIRVLGINEKGAKYLKELDNYKIYVNWKDIEKNIESSLIKIEKNAFLLYEVLMREKESLNVYYEK